VDTLEKSFIHPTTPKPEGLDSNLNTRVDTLEKSFIHPTIHTFLIRLFR
jgi:hypothetical protein